MYGASGLPGEVIKVGVKTHGAIIAAPKDVPRISGNGQARSVGHGEDSVAKGV